MLRRRAPPLWRGAPSVVFAALTLRSRGSGASARRAPGRRGSPRRAAGEEHGSWRGLLRWACAEQPGDIARERVDFEVHAPAGFGVAQARMRQRIGNDVDAEMALRHLVDSEAHAVERDRTLRGD